MSSFTQALVLEFVIDRKLWKVDKDFIYWIGEENSSDFVEVPKGFVTDLASIPWALRWLLPESGRYNQAAVVHDLLYQTGLYNKYNSATRWIEEKKLDRKLADEIFNEAMVVLGVKTWRRVLIYQGVRAGGWVPWKNYRKSDLYKAGTGT